ncbi:hypothetical protein GCM10007079_37080 [Nocardiopsis terrae]|nr:hypothetical protein GCM10007079_37080 [Nocardiopsis terrae]
MLWSNLEARRKARKLGDGVSGERSASGRRGGARVPGAGGAGGGRWTPIPRIRASEQEVPRRRAPARHGLPRHRPHLVSAVRGTADTRRTPYPERPAGTGSAHLFPHSGDNDG